MKVLQCMGVHHVVHGHFGIRQKRILVFCFNLHFWVQQYQESSLFRRREFRQEQKRERLRKHQCWLMFGSLMARGMVWTYRYMKGFKNQTGEKTFKHLFLPSIQECRTKLLLSKLWGCNVGIMSFEAIDFPLLEVLKSQLDRHFVGDGLSILITASVH